MIFGLVMFVLGPIIFIVLGFAGTLRLIKVSTFALVRTFGMNKKVLAVCAVVVAYWVVRGYDVPGVSGTLLTLATIPCACLLWWFGLNRLKDNSKSVSNCMDKWNKAYTEEQKKVKQHRREQDRQALETFDKGYNDIVKNGK